MISELKNIELPNIKILLTGNGKVAYGAKEMLDAMKITQVSVTEYLHNSFKEPVYCLADVLDYNKRKDHQVLDNFDFYKHPENYESDFMRFATVTDFLLQDIFMGMELLIFLQKKMQNLRNLRYNMWLIFLVM